MHRFSLLVGLVFASSTVAAPAPTYTKDVGPFLTNYCVKCHGGEKPRGSFRLDDIKDEKTALQSPKKWEKIADSLRSGEMPPDEAKKKPNANEIDAVNTWIDVTVFKVDCNGPRDPGRVTIRR